MPYLQVDVDALDAFDQVESMAGLAPGAAYRGLLRLWLHCWKKKTNGLPGDAIAAFFPGDQERLIRALVFCEFLAPLEDGDTCGYVVRGADKRLGISGAQSDAGKKRAAGASRDQLGRLLPSSPPAPIQLPSSPNPALTSNIQHPDLQDLNTAAATAFEQKRTVQRAPPKAPGPVLVVQKPTAPRAEWQFQEFQQWAQFMRQDEGLVPEDPVPIMVGDLWWAKVMAWTKGDVQPVCAAFVKFGNNKHWEAQGFPFKAFLKQWAQFMEPMEASRA